MIFRSQKPEPVTRSAEELQAERAEREALRREEAARLRQAGEPLARQARRLATPRDRGIDSPPLDRALDRSENAGLPSSKSTAEERRDSEISAAVDAARRA